MNEDILFYIFEFLRWLEIFIYVCVNCVINLNMNYFGFFFVIYFCFVLNLICVGLLKWLRFVRG